jgi:Tfp pilus assembly PilM family ATPase
MSRLLKTRAYLIGVDLGNDSLRLAQLASNGKGIRLIASGSEGRPPDVEPGSANWQRWAADTIRRLTANGGFQGKEVVAAMPATEVFIEHMRMPTTNNTTLQDAIFSSIKDKLPFEPVKQNVMIKCSPTEMGNVLVMATDRRIIDRHVALYEKANLHINSIGVWPAALTNCYSTFFGRRKCDIQAIVMLLDIAASCTNVVICHQKSPLFACSIPIGAVQLGDEKTITKLVRELTACGRRFGSMYQDLRIERLVLLSGRVVDRDVCATIAAQLKVPVRMEDCLAAVKIAYHARLGIDRRAPASGEMTPRQKNGQVNWATAFGLSLS